MNPRFAGAALVAATLAVAGCGSGDDSGSGTTAAVTGTTQGTAATTAATTSTTSSSGGSGFAQKADAICKPSVAAQKALTDRGLALLPKYKGLAKQIVALEPLIREGADLAAKLRTDLEGLDAPAADTDDVTAYLKVLTDRRVLLTRLADAGKDADTAAYTKTAKRLEDNTKDGKKLAKGLGLADCT